MQWATLHDKEIWQRALFEYCLYIGPVALLKDRLPLLAPSRRRLLLDTYLAARRRARRLSVSHTG